MKKLNTIYIISKGRPWCRTAKLLESLGYPEWFIVCGTNDETLPEYKKRWGNKVLVFDWKKETETTDTLDNFGFESMPSGATPVRNATIRISQQRGEKRHWQFDDDYRAFYLYNKQKNKFERIRDGKTLYNEMNVISSFADKANLPNAGFCLTNASFPDSACTVEPRVFNMHNLPSDPEKAQFWRGRMNDDLINAIEVLQKGGREFAFKFLATNMVPSQSEKGGLTDIYKEIGTVRKTAYAVLIAPGAVKLVIRFGRYHHRVNWDTLKSCVISEKFRRAE